MLNTLFLISKLNFHYPTVSLFRCHNYKFAFSSQDTNLLLSYFLCLSIKLNIWHLLKEEASRFVVKIKQCSCFILNMKNKVSSGVTWMIEPMYLQQSVYTAQDAFSY